ncbi:MAG: nitrogen fixation negative regulator NifL [Rhodocyclaceae bacterium]
MHIPSSPSLGPVAGTLFQHAVEQSAVAIAITDAGANILYVNPAFCRVTGYQPAEVIGRKQSVLSYRKTPREVYQALWAELTAGRPWSGRLLNRRKDGSPYIAELTVTPVLTPGDPGGDVHYLGLHRDVTEEHRQARQLANHKHLIESVISVAPMAVALLSGSGEVVLDNPAYQRVVADLRVDEPAHAVMEALRESLGELFHHAVAHRRALLNQELRFERPGGEPRWYSCSLAWFEEHSTAPDGFYGEAASDYMLLVMHDISAAKRQQEALRLSMMRERLSAAEFNQALREALSGAIFQLRGPVNLISVAAGLQRRRSGTAAASDPLLQALDDARQAGEDAISALQATMPPELREPIEPVNLNEVLHDVLMLETEALLAAGVTVDWQPALVLPPVQGDPAALRTLFRQLLSNAIEAMNVRGWRERNVLLRTSHRDGRVEAEVVDTGPGIPEALRLKVFEPFFSTKQGHRGARGVGLSLAQEVVSRHRGVLEIDPAHRGGCRMRLSFPASRTMPLELERHP